MFLSYVEGFISSLVEFQNYLGFGIKSSSMHLRPELSELVVWGNLLGNTSKTSYKAPKGVGMKDISWHIFHCT
jgi:hypothetical protein